MMMKSNNEAVPKILDELIDDFGMRPADIASKTGLGVMSIYRWKDGANLTRSNRNIIMRLYAREKKRREEKGE